MDSVLKAGAARTLAALLALLVLLTPYLWAQAKEQGSVELGNLLISPAYVDTGPFAAAEEGAWYAGHGDRFVVVIVKTETLTHGTLCSHFTAHLRVDSGAEYDLGGTLNTNNSRTVRPTIELHGEVKWPFRVKEGDKPVALILRRDTQGEKECGSGERSAWLTIGSEMLSLPLDGLGMAHGINVVEQPSRVVRLGQLDIIATAVGVGPSVPGLGGGLQAMQGHHFVVVCVGVRNVSRHPNCTNFQVHLIVDRGYEYREAYGGWFPQPRSIDLLPGEGRGGMYVFEPHDGTIPTALVLERSISAESFCADNQHRAVDVSGGARVRVHLDFHPRAGQPK